MEKIKEEIGMETEAPIGAEEMPITSEEVGVEGEIEHSELDCIRNSVKFDVLSIGELQELITFLSELKTQKELPDVDAETNEEAPMAEESEIPVEEGKIPENPNEVKTEDGAYQGKLLETETMFDKVDESRISNGFESLMKAVKQDLGE